jgi:hypothetical protein
VFFTSILRDTLVMLSIVGPAVGWFATVAGARWGPALVGIAALTAAPISVINPRHAHSKASN